VNHLPVCAECKYAELQCPPVIRCTLHGKFLYLNSPACKDFEPVEDEKRELNLCHKK